MKSGTKKKGSTFVKRILIIIAAVLVILDIIAGNYLVSFALMRSSASGVDVAPEPVTTKDTQDKVDEVWKSISSLTDEWVESADKETVSLTSKEGLKLVGDVFNTDKSSHKWLIAVHGYTSKRQHMYPYARISM